MVEENTIKETDSVSKSELSDLLCPLASICSAMVFASKDWSLNKTDAWIYGVAIGWDNESLVELKQKFNWSDEIIDRLKTLHNNFKKLIKKTDLWVVTKRDNNICHTSGNGGWRFTVCTNKAEAEYLADKYNRENYEGSLICGVKHLLDT